MALFNVGKKKEEKKTESCCCGSGSTAEEGASCCCGAPVEGICCVKVLGAGCKSCHELYENAQAAVKALGLPIQPPANYFPNDDDTQPPVVRWRGHANLLFSNWLNYFVYQTTPYDIMSIGQEE